LQSCRFCASVSVGPVMRQCLFSSVRALSFICQPNDGFKHVVNSFYNHQRNAVHDFNLLFIIWSSRWRSRVFYSLVKTSCWIGT